MDTNWLGKFVDVTVLLEPVNSGSVRTESKVLVVPGTLNVFRMNALTSFASPGEVAGCAFAATAEITTPATSAPVGVTDAPLAAAAAVVPCWPRVTAHCLRTEKVVIPNRQESHEHRQVFLERRVAEMLVHLVKTLEQ